VHESSAARIARRETNVTDATEREALLESLAAQRQHVLDAVQGLTEAELRRPVLPSGWTCLGLVQHLTLDVERFWFRAVVGGEHVELATGDAAWQVKHSTPARDVLDAHREEIRLGDEILAKTPLNAAPVWWPVGVGHLDAARELIDGRQHLVLT
jgi:uncharacterized damage-inducible protein DinB